MGWEHEPSTVWKAQDLYCSERQSFDKIAKGTGVAVSTLKRWCEQHDWKFKRAELAQAEAEIRVDRVLARSRLLKKLLESGDARDAQAVSALERMTLKLAEAERTRRPSKIRRFEPAHSLPATLLSPRDVAKDTQERNSDTGSLSATDSNAVYATDSDAAYVTDSNAVYATDSIAVPATDAERVAKLEDALNRRLSELLICPDEDILGMVKDFAAALRLAQSLRPSTAAASATVRWDEADNARPKQDK